MSLGNDLTDLTLGQVSKMLQAREVTAEGLASAYLTRIEKENPDLNVYLEVFDDVLEQAKAADRKLDRKEGVGVMTGVPLAIKDNILIKDRLVSSASLLLENYRASYDATVIEKLKSEGAVFLGRTNMDEFAMGGSTENSAFGPTKNPVDRTKVPGGSSGGSAAAVAGNLAAAALGSDTGGSIREPASFCGVVGLKPTYGAVSRYGVMAMASSLDQIGPLTRNVSDAEVLFRAIAGEDPNDPTSAPEPEMAKPAGKMTVGVPYGFFTEGLGREVKDNFKYSLERLEGLGHKVVEIEMPHVEHALACYYIIMPAEVSANMARFDGLRYGVLKSGDDLLADYEKTRGEGLGREVRRRIMLGTYVLSAGYYDAYYGRAAAMREMIRRDFEEVFETGSGSGVDVVAMPTAPSPAFGLGEKVDDPIQMYLEDVFTVPANLAGVPAISIPSGNTGQGLPLGLELIAPAWGEDRLFALGRQFNNEPNEE